MNKHEEKQSVDNDSPRPKGDIVVPADMMLYLVQNRPQGREIK
jgi:hypothetical protein